MVDYKVDFKISLGEIYMDIISGDGKVVFHELVTDEAIKAVEQYLRMLNE